MKKISCVIPTMWLAGELKDSCDVLNTAPSISDVIIIDNKHNSTTKVDFTKYGTREDLYYTNLYRENIKIYKHGKFKIVETKQNIFTSKSWNIGAALSNSLSTAEVLCLLNDDIVVGHKTFEFISRAINEEIGIVGTNNSYFNGTNNSNLPIQHREIKERPLAFGCCMFMLKKKYSEIPETLKVWFNDDWLIQKVQGTHVTLLNADITGRLSVTVDTSEPDNIESEIDRIGAAIKQDFIEWQVLKTSGIVK